MNKIKKELLIIFSPFIISLSLTWITYIFYTLSPSTADGFRNAMICTIIIVVVGWWVYLVSFKETRKKTENYNPLQRKEE